jgi:LacI family repressor for deo operon, udp, cdd, tsx, nupC, and nupG
MKKKNTTLQQVAEMAQVAPITVSRVLNNSGYVSEDKRQRVLDAARTLNYTPHAAAKELASRSGQAKMLAVVLPQFDNPFFVHILEGCQAVALEHGYDVLVYNTRGIFDHDRQAFESLMRRRVEGLIYAMESGPAGVPESLLADLLSDLHIPIVFVEHLLSGVTADRVTVDNETAGYDATRHLIEQGYRRIALIASQPYLNQDRDRWFGYRRALKEHNLEPVEYFIAPDQRKKVAGEQIVYRMLDQEKPPDAIFAASTLITIGVFQALKQRAVLMPDHIGLIGYGEVDWTSLLVPSLSIVSRPAEELGRQAVNLLLQRATDQDRPEQQIVLPITLLLRESSLRQREVQRA